MADDDDWDVDLDAVNNVSSAESRWGGTVGGSVDDTSTLSDLRDKVLASDKAKKAATGYQSSYGYGGKFGVEKDRMDKSAVDASYKPTPAKHSSVADGKIGFGGKFGVQSDRQDKSAEDFSYKATADKHASQKDYKTGFGGKFGVQTDRKDACAETWDYKAEANKHSSQTDASKGFGGKFGVQEDRKDASAHGWQPERKVAPAKSKPRIDSVVSVGNIKSMFEKPAGEDVSEKIAKHRAARAEQDRRERELQAREKPTIIPKDDIVHKSTKQPNRAEEARQLVAQSRVSAAASHFNQQPSATAPVPERPKPTRVFNSTSAGSAFESNVVQVKPILPKAAPSPVVKTCTAAEEARMTAESLRAEELAREQREKEEERKRKIVEEERLQRERQQVENRMHEQAAKLREAKMREQEDLNRQEEEKLRLRNEEMKKREQERVEQEAEERRLRMIKEEQMREEERLREEQRQMELEMMERQKAEDERLRMMEEEAQNNANRLPSSENTVPLFSSGQGLCAMALHDYDAAGEDEISFRQDDAITNVDTSVDDNWWVGSCHGLTGLFPANYVELLPSLSSQEDGATSNGQHAVHHAVALYDYDSEDPNDLTFQTDEVLIVEKMETEDWWYGSIGDRQGLFPSNHVELINQ